MRLLEYRKKLNEGVSKPAIYKVTDDEIIEMLLDIDDDYIKHHAKFTSKSYQIERSHRIPEDVLISVKDKDGDLYLAFTLNTKKNSFYHNRSASRSTTSKKEKILGDALAKKYETSGFWN